MFPKRDLNYIEKPITFELAKDGSNKDDFYCPAGTLDTKSFAKNYGGWPRSDIAIINEQTDINVAKAMMSKLVQLPESPSNGLSDTELILSSRSKYCQSIDEQVNYTQRMIQFREERMQALKEKAARLKAEKERKEQVISFDENKSE